MKFYFDTFLPSLQKKVYTSELLNKDYFILLKYISNNDKKSVAEFFDTWLRQNLKNLEEFKELTNLDKFIILLNVRSICIGNRLECIINNKKVSYLISDILLRLQEQCEDYSNIVNYSGLNIRLNLPKQLYIEDYDILCDSVIDTIAHDEKILYFHDFTKNDKEVFLETAPAALLEDIFEFISETDKKIKKIELILGSATLEIPPIYLSVYDNLMLDYLIELFKDDLSNFYSIMYAFPKKIKYQDFWNLTPAESRVLISLYNEDMKQQEEQLEKAKQEQPKISMPSIPKTPIK